MKPKTTPFPWHYYVKTVRSRIFFVLVSVSVTYAIVEFDPDGAFLKVLLLFTALCLLSIIHGIFRIAPFRKVLDEIEKIQVQLPHDKKLKILYQKDEWALIEQMLKLTEHYIEKQTELLDDQNRQSNLLIESIPNAIIIIDKYENFILCNKNFRDKFIRNKTAKVIEKEKLWKIFDGRLLNHFRDCLHKKEQVKITSFFIEEFGEYYDIGITPTFNNKKELTGALGIFHNVTQSKLTDKMRVDFVANVSHEIRTPLTSIKGYAQLLQAHRADIPEAFYPILDKIDKNAERLKDLFDNLLKLSVIESKYELNKEPTNIQDLTALVWANLKAKHNKKKIELETKFDIDEINCDRKLFEQVITNLLDNAIKYSNEASEVKIKISTKMDEKYYYVTVSDNGPGIKAEDLSRIFERFYRSQGVNQKAIEGSGLGLSIVKHIINNHRGQIEVHSKAGEGTSFTISLPV